MLRALECLATFQNASTATLVTAAVSAGLRLSRGGLQIRVGLDAEVFLEPGEAVTQVIAGAEWDLIRQRMQFVIGLGDQKLRLPRGFHRPAKPLAGHVPLAVPLSLQGGGERQGDAVYSPLNRVVQFVKDAALFQLAGRLFLVPVQ